jgi:ribonuclease P protein component
VLPAAARLRRREDFTAALRGRRAGRGALVVHLGAAPGTGPRCGLVVSKAVGGSVERHRVARRLRHLLRERLPALPASDVVVRALPGAAERSAADLGGDLDAALQALTGRRP